MRRSVELPLALLRANRFHIVDLLEHTPGAMEKSIRLAHPEKPEARATVFDVLEMQAGHIVGHIKNIQAILQAHHV